MLGGSVGREKEREKNQTGRMLMTQLRGKEYTKLRGKGSKGERNTNIIIY